MGDRAWAWELSRRLWWAVEQGEADLDSDHGDWSDSSDSGEEGEEAYGVSALLEGLSSSLWT